MSFRSDRSPRNQSQSSNKSWSNFELKRLSELARWFDEAFDVRDRSPSLNRLSSQPRRSFTSPHRFNSGMRNSANTATEMTRGNDSSFEPHSFRDRDSLMIDRCKDSPSPVRRPVPPSVVDFPRRDNSRFDRGFGQRSAVGRSNENAQDRHQGRFNRDRSPDERSRERYNVDRVSRNPGVIQRPRFQQTDRVDSRRSRSRSRNIRRR